MARGACGVMNVVIRDIDSLFILQSAQGAADPLVAERAAGPDEQGEAGQGAPVVCVVG